MNMVTIAAAIFISIVYTIIVYKCGSSSSASSNMWSWWHGLMSTLVSVLLGVAVAVLLFHYQSNLTEQSNRDRYTSLLKSELTDCHNYLSDSKHTTASISTTNYYVVYTYVQPLILEEAAKSNLFSPRDTENMLHLARKMRLYNLNVERFMQAALSSHPSAAANITAAVTAIENTQAKIVRDIEQIMSQMGIGFSQSKPR